MVARTFRRTMRPCLGVEVAQAATRLATEVYYLTREAAAASEAWAQGLRVAADSLASVLARIQGNLAHTAFLHTVAVAGVRAAEVDGYLMIAEQCGALDLDDLELLQSIVGFIKRFCVAGLGSEASGAVRPELVS